MYSWRVFHHAICVVIDVGSGHATKHKIAKRPTNGATCLLDAEFFTVDDGDALSAVKLAFAMLRGGCSPSAISTPVP